MAPVVTAGRLELAGLLLGIGALLLVGSTLVRACWTGIVGAYLAIGTGGRSGPVETSRSLFLAGLYLSTGTLRGALGTLVHAARALACCAALAVGTALSD